MLARKMTWLVVSIVLLTFASSGHSQAAEKKTVRSKSITQKKEWRVIDGFRSAKFGMNEKQVIRAIAKDFNISKKKIERITVPGDNTKALIIHTANLIGLGGAADIVYILGYKSKKLVRVNIDWGKDVTNNFDPADLILTTKLLIKYFIKKRFKKDGYSDKVNEGYFWPEVIFRVQDKKDRVIFLHLKTPKPKKVEDKKEAGKNMTLLLAYIASTKNPDRIKANNKP